MRSSDWSSDVCSSDLAWGEGKVEKPDPDTIAGHFATEGEWHLWVPGQVVQGREAIRAEIERQREFSTFMECGIVKLVSAGTSDDRRVGKECVRTVSARSRTNKYNKKNKTQTQN